MITIGILGAAEIAFRRFLPALLRHEDFQYVGVASRSTEKAQHFAETYGGRIFQSYEELLDDPSIDAVYVPLPPALHAYWGEKVLQAGKHLLMEKPFTTSLIQTERLLSLARENNLAVHENYMFLYHSQLNWIQEQLQLGKIGELRLIRTAFGFPFRGTKDFRYDAKLGGGALFDCGGYPVRLATHLLGESAKVETSRLCIARDLDVDIYGTATLENACGVTAQVAFGMDNSYKCELELWGSTGCIFADRIFTAPAGFKPTVRVRTQEENIVTELAADDTFFNSIQIFASLIQEHGKRQRREKEIYQQSMIIDQIKEENTI